jgi:hypothetical protein
MNPSLAQSGPLLLGASDVHPQNQRTTVNCPSVLLVQRQLAAAVEQPVQ